LRLAGYRPSTFSSDKRLSKAFEYPPKAQGGGPGFFLVLGSSGLLTQELEPALRIRELTRSRTADLLKKLTLLLFNCKRKIHRTARPIYKQSSKSLKTKNFFLKSIKKNTSEKSA